MSVSLLAISLRLGLVVDVVVVVVDLRWFYLCQRNECFIYDLHNSFVNYILIGQESEHYGKA